MMKKSRRMPIRTAALIAALMLALTACGGGGGGDTAAEIGTESGDADAGGDASGETEAGGEASGETGGTVTIAALTDNLGYDPSQLRLGHFLQYWLPVYDTLITLDSSAELLPNLATEWEYNDDQTVLSLTLRDDVTFTDGEPFDGEAVRANIENLRDGNGPFAYMAGAVEEVVVTSDTEVELHLSEPDPGLLDNLAVVGGAMASPAALDNDDIATNPVGSGPYTLDQDRTTQGTQYTYVRNPDYWNPDDYAFDEIVIRPITDVTARVNALRSGEADEAVIDVANREQVEASGLDVDTTQINWRGLVIADREGEMVPALGDPRVRQAINMAFDRQALVDNVLRGQGAVTSQVFNPLSGAYVEEHDAYYDYDVEQARQLMEEAGYGDGFTVTMPESAVFANVNSAIQQALAEIGITVEYETMAPNTAIPEILSGRFPMFFFSLGSQAAWQDFQGWILPTSPWNTAQAEDPELTELLETAQSTQPGDERTQAFQDINTWLVENAWFAPLYREDTPLATTADVAINPHAWYVSVWPRDYSHQSGS